MMKLKIFLNFLLFLVLINNSNAQKNSYPLKLNLTVSVELQKNHKSKGRLFIFLNKDSLAEPRTNTWPSKGNNIFAQNIGNFDKDKVYKIEGNELWTKTPEWDLKNVPQGVYYIQILWDQENKEVNINAENNIYSKKQQVNLNKGMTLDIVLDQWITPIKIMEHKLIREITLKSDTLSKWWGKDMVLKASVLLPSKYKEGENKAYPIRYNVAGYGGRYDRVNRIMKNKKNIEWWESPDAPQVINVFLDGDGPFGDSYQLDSDNSGAFGYSLIHELIPYIENKYRGTNSAETRFVDGCSTGGWVSLALQIYYPQFFNGCYSYSPDAVTFTDYQLINIYRDDNAFTNEFNYLRPVMRDTKGEPMMSLKDFITYENALGVSNSYQTSGGQFGAHTALYSPKGKDGLPKPMFNPLTGDIDHDVAEQWKKYDLQLYMDKNWKKLGPQLQGKINIWMGDMDHFYLNIATRSLDKFLKSTKDPVSDANIKFIAEEGHCSMYSFREVTEMIEERVKK